MAAKKKSIPQAYKRFQQYSNPGVKKPMQAVRRAAPIPKAPKKNPVPKVQKTSPASYKKWLVQSGRLPSTTPVQTTALQNPS